MNAKSFDRLTRNPAVQCVDDSGCEGGRFLVYLKPEFSWTRDPWEVTRVRGFGSITEAAQALRSGVVTAAEHQRSIDDAERGSA